MNSETCPNCGSALIVREWTQPPLLGEMGETILFRIRGCTYCCWTSPIDELVATA